MSEQNQPLQSVSLDVFKSMNGITTITVMKGKGRRFADTVAGRLYFAASADLKRPLYVAKGKYESYWVFNTAAQATGEVL